MFQQKCVPLSLILAGFLLQVAVLRGQGPGDGLIIVIKETNPQTGETVNLAFPDAKKAIDYIKATTQFAMNGGYPPPTFDVAKGQTVLTPTLKLAIQSSQVRLQELTLQAEKAKLIAAQKKLLDDARAGILSKTDDILKSAESAKNRQDILDEIKKRQSKKIQFQQTDWVMPPGPTTKSSDAQGKPPVTIDSRLPKSLLGTTWQRAPGYTFGGTQMVFYSETKARVTPMDNLANGGGRLLPNRAYDINWRQNPDGTFLINHGIGSYQYGGKYLKITYKGTNYYDGYTLVGGN
jgi:hypothetical protein